MGVPVVIDDPDDERLGHYRSLRDAHLSAGPAGEAGVFVVEGRLALEQLLGSGHPVVSVLLTPDRATALAGWLSDVSAPVYVVDRRVMAATAGFDLHRGVVAIGARRPLPSPAAVMAGGTPLLVLEGINDHENLGVLFRTGRALGVGGALLDPTCADPLYRRSIRVSLGHVLRVPHARLGPWPAGLALLAERGYRVVALTPDPAAPAIDEVEVPAGPVAVMVGSEGPGLSKGARAAATGEVRIPMAAGVDSLNVATAAGIALHRLIGARRGPRA